MKKNKSSIRLQLDTATYKKMRLKSFVMKYLLYVMILLIGLFLGHYLLKQLTITNSDSDTIKVDKAHPFVSDNAQVLDKAVIEDVQRINQDFSRTDTKPQLMVITVNQIPKDETIESFTKRLGNQIGVGNSEFDNGIIYLLSIKDRKARLEVGYELASKLSKNLVEKITDETVKGYYKSSDYSTGVQIVTKRINDFLLFDQMPDNQRKPRVAFFHSIRLFILNSNFGQWLLVIACLVSLYFLSKLRKSGQKLSAQLVLVDMANHYLKDINALSDSTSFTESVFISKKSEKLKAVRETLETDILYPIDPLAKLSIPAYYDMNFAFGKVTPKEFIANYVNGWKKFRNSSMSAHFWKTTILWPHLPHFWIGETYWRAVPESVLPSCRLDIINENVIPVYLKIFLRPMAIILKYALISVLIIAIYVQSSLLHLSLTESISLTITKFVDYLSQLDMLLIISSIYFAIPVFFVFSYIKSIGIGLQNRLRLDTMIRSYIKDLKQVNTTEFSTIKDMARNLDNKEYARQTKALKKWLEEKAYKNQDTKNKYPDYYDMKFAYGTVTIAEFLASLYSDTHLRKKSMYINHSTWWSDSNTSNDSISSSSDSFGGGSFGGDGGTSSW